MPTKQRPKNDIAWEYLFKKYDIFRAIERDGLFNITSEQINTVREARLMTKFDHHSNLPRIFAEHQLAILPITRGSYCISHFDVYQTITTKPTVIPQSFPAHIESLDYDTITSEAAAVNCAYISGMIADFVEDEQLLPTVSGRMSSTAFTFTINHLRTGRDIPLEVTNAQIEIDGGYEGRRFLTLIEAKNALSHDFLIRQLYYPFRAWAKGITKQVKPVFLIYTNGVFSFYEYEFTDPLHYNALILKKQKNYRIDPHDIELDEIEHILHSVRIVPEPEIAFPQANSMKRIINLCELLHEEGELTSEAITTNYDFDVRQTRYYTDAGRYLGLLERQKTEDIISYALTETGRALFRLKHKARQLRIAELILRHRAFNDCLRHYFKTRKKPGRKEIIDIMMRSNLYGMKSRSTFERRATTVSSWLEWIRDLHSGQLLL